MIMRICALLAFCLFSSAAFPQLPKKILIVVEGGSELSNYAMGDGRQLAALLGHFNTQTTIKGVNRYSTGEINGYDITFYVGFHAKNSVSSKFTSDVLHTNKQIVWLNTGFAEFSSNPEVGKKFGFRVTVLDSTSSFDGVRFSGKFFTKGEPNLNRVQIQDRSAKVLAVASSSKTRRESPYMVQSKNLLYIADSPFASASETDRYLLFSDYLHEIIGEQHEESHSALIRIEDVGPLDDPDKLREIADKLSSLGIPFLVGVYPIHVDPGIPLRVTLSEKPDMVDALKYMVRNGGTIVMHGTTHQYKGVSAVDFEFWDESTNKPIRDETVEAISRKLDLGIQEFMKNGLYPLVWETPHYTASFQLYKTVSKYFSTAMEQRLSIEDYDYSQYFPYVIKKDLFGQRIYPENLGFVRLDTVRSVSEGDVQKIIRGAKANLAVRDGFAACFFHSFLDLDLLEELVKGIQKLGYTYIDLREQTHWAKTKDRVILSGSQSFTITLDNQYLLEAYYDQHGEIRRKETSERRIKGPVTKSVVLEPGEFYKAEPIEFRERQLTFSENLAYMARKLFESVKSTEEDWREARVAVLWNQYARGARFNDQASFVATFASVNLKVDTIFIGQEINLSKHNLLVAPFSVVDSLKTEDYDVITKFVYEGGCVITDSKNDLAEELGIRFSKSLLRVSRVRDQFFPEEQIAWRYFETMNAFDADDVDEVFCRDEATQTPIVIGKRHGKGRVLFIGTRFDPLSQRGYSHFPYLIEYVRRYFKLRPLVRRDNLQVFFEPGLRKSSISIEQLVKIWVNQGIRKVHVSGWHQYPEHTYDYERLIRLAHANGILVYAWFEPPQVSQKFWTEHPEWREKNYKGEDARPSWRFPVALTDEKCLAAVTNEYRKFLESYDFDGLNLAELYFEAAKGFEDPATFTPMHPSAQAEVRQKFGIELSRIFDPSSPYFWKTNPQIKEIVANYRVAKLTHVYEILLQMLTDHARSRPGFQIIVTALDSYGSPELRDEIGVDMTEILRLQKKYDFVLQVEDPERLWSTDPMRYVEIGRKYRRMVGDPNKLYLDLNITGTFRKKDVLTPFPTLIQTGTESFHLIRAASLGASEFTVYAEATINPQDLIFLSYANASDVHIHSNDDGYKTISPRSFSMKFPKDVKEISIDGEILSPFRDNVYMVPSGEHFIRPNAGSVGTFSTHELQTRIMSITGNLLSASYGLRGVVFEYQSETAALVSFNKEPTAIRLDGNDYPLAVLKGNDCFTIRLPQGRHTAQILSGGEFSYGISVTSLWSTTAIAIFGILAVLLLIGMYASIKVVRRRIALDEPSIR